MAAALTGTTKEAGNQGSTSTWSATVRVQMVQQTVTGGAGTTATAGADKGDDVIRKDHPVLRVESRAIEDCCLQDGSVAGC